MRILVIPVSVLTETWRAFQEGALAGVESTVRWAGPAALSRADLQVATTVVTPIQRVSAGHFEIPHEGTRAMGEALRANGLVNVAQVHTHPSDWVGHSPWDDSHAYSSREHALSVVWPRYGAGLPPVEKWGVHERLNGQWSQLSARAISDRVHIVPDSVRLGCGLELISGFHEGESDNAFDRTARE